jgi:hypothetical protein
MKKQIYTIYYLILALVMVVQVIQTIYQSSLALNNNNQLKELYSQQQSLVSKQQKLQAQLSKKVSLTNFTKTDMLKDYQQITNPIIITLSNNLAAKE